MSLHRPFSALGLAALVFSLAVLLTAASPAHADRCQPEELVTGSGTSPVPEESDPRCFVMDTVFYDNVRCDDTTLRRCLDTFSASGTVYDVVHVGSRCEIYLNGKMITPYLCYGP